MIHPRRDAARGRHITNQRGLTLVEVLVAASIITIGLIAVAGGLQYALAAVDAARQQTTALFLAEEKLEQVKARALVDFDGVAAAGSSTEESVLGHPRHRRIVGVTPDPAGVPNALRVQVTVTYRPAAVGSAPGQWTVSLATILSRRA